MKIELTSSQEQFVQVVGKQVNNTYIFFPKVLKKLGNREYEEISLKDLPIGIRKYILDQLT